MTSPDASLPTEKLFENNRAWAARVREQDPGFFQRLSAQQAPQYLWIGCSDSRAPANQLLGLLPGELFVHRNIANVVSHGDLNCLSVVQFAVEVLNIQHIFVVGHYGCAGVSSVLHNRRVGLADNWLRHIDDVAIKHRRLLTPTLPADVRFARLCELNAMEQVGHLCQTTIVRDAWKRGQSLTVHSWIYDIRDGLLRDLGVTVSGGDDFEAQLEGVIQRYAAE